MAKMTPSQFKSQLRALESKQKQAIAKYNQDVRRFNQAYRQSINQYNTAVNQYNTRARQYQQKIRSELARLQSRTPVIHYTILHQSSIALNLAHNRLENDEALVSSTSNFGNTFLDLSDRENVNSLSVINILEENQIEDSDTYNSAEKLSGTKIIPMLSRFSTDYADRWSGALYALNPKNPDASRHFCTSSREIFTGIIESYAPDVDVLAWNPNCNKIENYKPSRKAKLQYLLSKKNITVDSASEFVDSSIDNILKLFRSFNDATHGNAGKYSMAQLSVIKTRVEDGIEYLSTICM